MTNFPHVMVDTMRQHGYQSDKLNPSCNSGFLGQKMEVWGTA